MVHGQSIFVREKGEGDLARTKTPLDSIGRPLRSARLTFFPPNTFCGKIRPSFSQRHVAEFAAQLRDCP